MGNGFRFIFFALLIAYPAWGAERVPGASAQDLLQWLEQDSAELAAARHEATGARQRAEAAGALPDPSLRIEWFGISRTNPTLAPSQVGSMKYTVLQPLPGRGKRDLQKQVAEAGAVYAREQQRAVGADLRTQVKIAFAGYYRAHHALLLNEELGRFADSAARLARTRYETGLATQQELVKAQLEQSALQSERFALQADLSQNQARINALLNRPAHAELQAPAVLRPLPPPAVLDEAALERRLRSESPQLAGQAAQVAAAEGGVELARKNLTPDFILGIAPVQRGSRLDSWDAMLEFTIPLQRVAHHTHQHEASEMLEASRARQQAIEARLVADLREQYAALEAARNLEVLAHQRSLPLAELAFNGARAGYRNGRVDFATLLEARRQLRQARLDELDARVAQQVRLAEIERLIGEEL